MVMNGTSANAEIIGLNEPNCGGETVHIQGCDVYRSGRWDYEQGIDSRTVKLKHGGAILLVAERVQEHVVFELMGAHLEAVAVLS